MEIEVSASENNTSQVDIGIQCALGINCIITKTVSTQTDFDSGSLSVTDASVQADEETYSRLYLDSLHDHTYYHPISNVSPQKSEKSISPQKSIRSIASTSSCPLFSSDEEDVYDDDYTASASQDTGTSTDTNSEPELLDYEKYVSEPKYLVFGSCLKELFKFCISCGANVTELKIIHTGCLVTVKTTCLASHDAIWNSQPLVNRTPVGTLLLCSSVLFTGNTFSRIQDFASCLGLQLFSKQVFYRNQDKYLFPIINEAWERERRSVIEELSNKEIVKLNGDGRSDSPGHNAKYGTYTFMDSESGKVVSFNLVQVTEVSSSNAMEKEGFVRCLNSLEDDGISISTITTDRHTSIASTMQKDYSHITHQYDVWHLSKSILKKLRKKAKLKKNQDLNHWLQSISNHLWWSAATCNGDVVLLREKWVSVLHHVQNKHSWKDTTIFKKCTHPRLSRRAVRQKCWLEPGSSAAVALEEVILAPRILNDLARLTAFCHTGGLEVYHSMLLKYCPKRQHFSYNGMVARTQLAALDNNHNTGMF